MAFDAGTIQKTSQGSIIVEVNSTDADGNKQTNRYRLRSVSRGEMVKMLAESRKQGEGMLGANLTGRLFEDGEEMDGGASVYDLLDAMDEKHSESFMEYVTELATASRSKLNAMGVNVE